MQDEAYTPDCPICEKQRHQDEGQGFVEELLMGDYHDYYDRHLRRLKRNPIFAFHYWRERRRLRKGEGTLWLRRGQEPKTPCPETDALCVSLACWQQGCEAARLRAYDTQQGGG